MAEVARVYNEDLGHESTFGSRPVDVIGPEPTGLREDNLVDFQAARKMARSLKHNTELNSRTRERLMDQALQEYVAPAPRGTTSCRHTFSGRPRMVARSASRN